VGDASEIDPAWLTGINRLGLTAGASAPESLVEGVLTRLATLRSITVEQLAGEQENVSFSLPAALRRAPV